MAAALEAVERFLFKDFPSRATFTKDYEKDQEQTTTEAIDKRFTGYQKICLYGLGSVFWGAATGVLDKVQEKHPDWVHWGSTYFAISFVLMLKGLSAATFPSSTPLARGTAGLGALTAYIYMLATFHVASLKFHCHVEECVYSMIISAAAVTIHWGYSSQDPLFFHLLSKCFVWLLLLIPYGVVKPLSLVLGTIVRVISALRGLVRKHGNSREELLLERSNATEGDVSATVIVSSSSS